MFRYQNDSKESEYWLMPLFWIILLKSSCYCAWKITIFSRILVFGALATGYTVQWFLTKYHASGKMFYYSWQPFWIFSVIISFFHNHHHHLYQYRVSTRSVIQKFMTFSWPLTWHFPFISQMSPHWNILFSLLAYRYKKKKKVLWGGTLKAP